MLINTVFFPFYKQLFWLSSKDQIMFFFLISVDTIASSLDFTRLIFKKNNIGIHPDNLWNANICSGIAECDTQDCDSDPLWLNVALRVRKIYTNLFSWHLVFLFCQSYTCPVIPDWLTEGQAKHTEFCFLENFFLVLTNRLTDWPTDSFTHWLTD